MTAAPAQSGFARAAFSPINNPTLLNLLIVDDERTVRDACREVASALGYRATVTESAEQALRLAEARNIDVIFLDLKVPANGGLTILQQIKARRPDVEIV